MANDLGIPYPFASAKLLSDGKKSGMSLRIVLLKQMVQNR